MNVAKEQLHQWYVVEMKSYRQIMSELGINNARKVKKLLTENGIEIRKGSDAVKTQWLNNEERRKKQSEFLSLKMAGKENTRRLSDEEIQQKLTNVGLILLNREITDGYTTIEAKCDKCGQVKLMDLKQIHGCRACASIERGIKQRTPYQEVLELFNSFGVVLLDTNYENAAQSLGYICPKHSVLGVQYISYAKAKEYGCCHKCRVEKRREKYGFAGNEREMMSSDLRSWRLSVFERDNFTCQCCGDSKGGNLQAHHINNFSTHKHLRLDIDNGITLCENCHNPRIVGSFHHVYGTKDNTYEQLIEYIANKQKSLIL